MTKFRIVNVHLHRTAPVMRLDQDGACCSILLNSVFLRLVFILVYMSLIQMTTGQIESAIHKSFK